MLIGDEKKIACRCEVRCRTRWKGVFLRFTDDSVRELLVDSDGVCRFCRGCRGEKEGEKGGVGVGRSGKREGFLVFWCLLSEALCWKGPVAVETNGT